MWFADENSELQEILTERGVTVDHAQRYTPEMEKRRRRCASPPVSTPAIC